MGAGHESYRKLGGFGEKSVSLVPIGVKAVAQNGRAQGQDILCAATGPKHSGLLEPLTNHGSASCFHDT